MGTTNLYFNATRRGGGVVTSSPNEIQVFSALTLSPKEIWLVPGAIFQVCVCVCVCVWMWVGVGVDVGVGVWVWVFVCG